MDDQPDNNRDKASSTAPSEVSNKSASIEVIKSDSTVSIPDVVVSYDSDESLQESTVCYHFSPKKRKRAPRPGRLSAKAKNLSPPLKDDTLKNSIAVHSPPEEEPQCNFCGKSPCILDQGLYDLLVEGGLLFEEDDVQALKNQIRYDIYRKAARFLWGPLKKGDRRKLPHCVMTEIHDFAPENDVKNYTGFQEKQE